MSKIGANIRKIRLTKGFSQAQFANIFGLTRASIGAYEEGRAEPKIDTVIEIAKYFSISLDIIFTKNITVNSLTNFNVSKISNSDPQFVAPKNTVTLNVIAIEANTDAKSLLKFLDKKKTSNPIEFPKLIAADADTYFNLTKSGIEGLNAQNILGMICKTNTKPQKDATVMIVTAEAIAIGNYINGTETITLQILNSSIVKEFKNVKYIFEIQSFFTHHIDIIHHIDAKLAKLEARLDNLNSN
jgi:transcriptional regulator with XRE-family HTH domain